MKKVYLSIIALIFVLALLFVFKHNKKELIVGTTPTFPPFTYIGGQKNNEVVGFDIELAKEIANDREQKISIRVLQFDELFTALQNGTIDIAVGFIGITDERKERVDFSDPSFSDSIIALIKKKNLPSFQNITSKRLLGENVKLATVANTLLEGYIREVAGDNEFQLFDNYDDAVQSLIDGNSEAVVMSTFTARSYKAKNDNLIILPSVIFSNSEGGIAYKKGNDSLGADINKTLERIRASGRYDELITQYFK